MIIPRQIALRTCKRCGTCCVKGGPALHEEDLHLVMAGILRPSHLVTLRAGEIAFHPGLGTLIELEDELIRIRGKECGWTCFFYDEVGKACTIYEDRPAECRVLACWDDRAISELFLRGTIRRMDLLGNGTPVLNEIIQAYEKAVPVRLIHALVVEAGHTAGDSSDLALLEEKDNAFRERMVMDLGLDENHLELWFGRSVRKLSRILKQRKASSLGGLSD